MEVFQQHPSVLQGVEAKKIIKNYNKLAKVLLEFEVLYHRGWLRQVRTCLKFLFCVTIDDIVTNKGLCCCISGNLKEICFTHVIIFQVEAAKSGIQSTLLVKHPETGELFVNFDPQILGLIRETECMARLRLEIPPVARGLRSKQSLLKDNFNALKVSILY